MAIKYNEGNSADLLKPVPRTDAISGFPKIVLTIGTETYNFQTCIFNKILIINGCLSQI